MIWVAVEMGWAGSVWQRQTGLGLEQLGHMDLCGGGEVEVVAETPRWLRSSSGSICGGVRFGSFGDFLLFS